MAGRRRRRRRKLNCVEVVLATLLNRKGRKEMKESCKRVEIDYDQIR